MNPISLRCSSGWSSRKRSAEPIPSKISTIGRASSAAKSSSVKTHRPRARLITLASSILLGPRSSKAWSSSAGQKMLGWAWSDPASGFVGAEIVFKWRRTLSTEARQSAMPL